MIKFEESYCMCSCDNCDLLSATFSGIFCGNFATMTLHFYSIEVDT